ncbi:MAG TPA: hypothetical protein PLM98_01975 [Thiolinea sp.]|nr:hypothetical protein [Thiolinea sp.]
MPTATPSKEYRSPNGLTERSTALPHIPTGVYSKKDGEQETKLTNIDFYSDKIALCPKTWSTSPGTMVRDLSETTFTQSSYEPQFKGKTVPKGVKKAAVFKQSMNESNTSGTFSPAALLYYHLSRYFDTSIDVPVAVYREMDSKPHYQRVTQRGVAQTSTGMIAAGWRHMAAAEKNPGSFAAAASLFTPDRKKIYGCMLKAKGTRYGAEINGVRSRWGIIQNEEFQRTAPYLALSSSLPLLQAIEDGKKQAFKSTQIRKETVDATPFQMMYWMKELTEIVLLDFIFSQQDRIGNIDYEWRWYWVANNEVKSQSADSKLIRSQMSKIKPPADIAGFAPQLLQRTCLNDNDAGGRVPYTNFAKKTGMLPKLRHFSGAAYKRLLRLNADLQDSGQIYKYLQSNFGLDSGQLTQIVNNTRLAKEILQDTCSLGKLQFDLDEPQQFFLTGKVKSVNATCV